MKRLTFLGTVKDGRVYPDDSGALRANLQGWEGKRVSVEVEREYKRRTTQQNRRYWSVIVPCVAELLTKTRDLPISSDQAHYLLKAAFLGQVETDLGPVPKSTRNLSTAEFAEYCDRIEAHFASIGHPLPITEAA